MDGETVKFEELQKANREYCTRVVHQHLSTVYEQLKRQGLQPDYIFLGIWDCLFDDVLPEMSDLGAGYVSELMGFEG